MQRHSTWPCYSFNAQLSTQMCVYTRIYALCTVKWKQIHIFRRAISFWYSRAHSPEIRAPSKSHDHHFFGAALQLLRDLAVSCLASTHKYKCAYLRARLQSIRNTNKGFSCTSFNRQSAGVCDGDIVLLAVQNIRHTRGTSIFCSLCLQSLSQILPQYNNLLCDGLN